MPYRLAMPHHLERKHYSTFHSGCQGDLSPLFPSLQKKCSLKSPQRRKHLIFRTILRSLFSLRCYTQNPESLAVIGFQPAFFVIASITSILFQVSPLLFCRSRPPEGIASVSFPVFYNNPGSSGVMPSSALYESIKWCVFPLYLYAIIVSRHT